MAWTKTTGPGIIRLVSDNANDYDLAAEDANFANGLRLVAAKMVDVSNAAGITVNDKMSIRHANATGVIFCTLKSVDGGAVKDPFLDTGYYYKPYFKHSDFSVSNASNVAIILEYR